MSKDDEECLLRLAARYIWWKTPDAVTPERVVAQVMNIGDYADVQIMAEQVGDNFLRHVLSVAEPGQFNERSWAYWHYRLGLAGIGRVPSLPQRKFA